MAIRPPCGLRAVVGVRLLPYHTASSKYAALRRPDTMPPVAEPTKDQMAALAARLAAFLDTTRVKLHV